MQDFEVANVALAKIGLENIISLSDPTKAGKLMNLLFPTVRDEMLRLLPWRCARKRARLGTIAWQPLTAYAVGTILSVPVVSMGITSNVYFVVTVAGTSGAAIPASWPQTGTIVDGTVTWAYTSNNTTRYAFQYTLPADCLKVLSINDFEAERTMPSAPYMIIGSTLYTDEGVDPTDGNPVVEYIYQLTTVPSWESNLCELVAIKLSILAAPLLAGGAMPQLQADFAIAERNARAALGYGASREREPQRWTEVGGRRSGDYWDLAERYGWPTDGYL